MRDGHALKQPPPKEPSMSHSEPHQQTATMLIQLGPSWAVCTRSPVPIILERFETRSEAVQWQQYHESRLTAHAAA